MDSTRQGNRVVVLGASNDSRMDRVIHVESGKVTAVERQHRPALGGGKRQHVRVGNALAGPAGVSCGQDVVAQAPQFCHNLVVEVLIGVEGSHGSSGYPPLTSPPRSAES